MNTSGSGAPLDGTPAAPAEHFPQGLNNAFLFATFNALSFQLVLSSPMILFAKSLGATATVLGIMTGMMPLLVIFQIPAANHIPRYGYKKFVYSGWGIRVMFIFGIALVPLAGAIVSAETQLALLLFLLFGFNLSRGISSCAWLPWITSLVPPGIRGKYLVRDAACVNLASFCTIVLAGLCLGARPAPWQFAVVFAFSACMGVISLSFLKRIPESGPPEMSRSSATPVPWLEIARYAPFRKLLRMNVAWSIAYGGMTAFTVAYLKTEAGMSEALILLTVSSSYVGGLSSLWILGSSIDELGSKPILTFSISAWLLILLGWTALAGKLLAPQVGVVLILQFLMGLAAALVSMSNTKLAMTIVPVMGRNHFFALFSVVGNLTLGLAPILWGFLIDILAATNLVWLGMAWNRFTIFFAAVTASFIITLAFARRLEEPQAATLEKLLRQLFIHAPQRVWVRLWPRI